MIELEVGQIFRRKSTNKKMNTISNPRSQWFGRYIEFTITEIDGDNIEYRTLHPTWGEVNRVSTRARFLKMVNPTIKVHYKNHPLYRSLSKDMMAWLDNEMSFLKENLRSRDQDERVLKEVEQFPRADDLRTLYLNSDEEGEIMETVKQKKAATTKTAAKSESGPKEVYGRGAYRRWKKSGALSEDGKTVTIKDVVYNVTKEGSKFKLTK